MDVSELIERLQVEGARMTDVVAPADPGAPVPTCPDWAVRDLVRHLGGVHRWATGFVRGGDQPNGGDLEELVGGWPLDQELPAWFAMGHRDLVVALRSAPPDLQTWTFLDAPSPLAFWARRQAHETAIHRVDAESAIGEITGFPAPFAVDGIDELLLAFVARGGSALPIDREQTMLVEATDARRSWLVTFAPDGLRTSGDAEGADPSTRVRGSASDLYVWLWNRRGTEGLGLEGNRELPVLWRDHVRVRWS